MVNDQVHNAIDKLLQQDREQSLDLSIIDIEQQIARADPTVWQMLRLIARTREERKKTHQVFSRRRPIDNQIPMSILYHVLRVFHNRQQM